MSLDESNPYRSPAIGDAMLSGTFYRVQSTKLNAGEYWRMSPNLPSFLLGLLIKLFRVPLNIPIGFGTSENIQAVQWSDLSERCRTKMLPMIEQAKGTGMVAEFLYRLPTVGPADCAAGALRSEDGQIMMLVVYARSWANNTLEEKTKWSFLSRLQDGRWLATASERRELDTPPGIDGLVLKGKSMAEILECHRDRLATVSPPVAMRNAAELAEQIVALEKQDFAYQNDRGAYVPMTVDEVQHCVNCGQNPAPTKSVSKAGPLYWLGLIGWIVLAFTVVRMADDPIQNRRQLLLRAAFLAIGAICIIAAWVAKKWANSSDD